MDAQASTDLPAYGYDIPWMLLTLGWKNGDRGGSSWLIPRYFYINLQRFFPAYNKSAFMLVPVWVAIKKKPTFPPVR